MGKLLRTTIIYAMLFLPSTVLSIIGMKQFHSLPLPQWILVFFFYMVTVHLIATGAMKYAKEWSK